MDRKCIAVMACISILTLGSIFPAYAEVSSLKTNSGFYKGGSKIYFSGTIGDADPSGVTLVIFNPSGQFILLSSAIAGSDHTFQIIVDTSISDNQQKFSTKGMYNATAFIANQQNGKTVSFIYSPDGSAMAPSSPIGLTSSVSSSNVITLNWSSPTNNGGASISGYMIERGTGGTWSTIVPNTGSTSTTYSDTGLSASTSYTYRVSAINSAGRSDPSNVVTIATFSQTPATQSSGSSNPTGSSGSSSSSSTPTLEELIQQRIEQAKKLQEQLNLQAGKQQSLNLVENIGVGDSIAQNNLKNNPTVQNQNNVSTQFDFGSILYPLIAVIGAGIVGAIFYLRKIGVFPQQNLKKQRYEVPEIAEQEDYAMMILKNRLAKGEITLDQFQSLKEVLLEP